jgi:uncharacterized protein (DUF1810 family)
MIRRVSDQFNLERFVSAQRATFESALSELNAGCKTTHWMWFIFPQLAGLGRSANAQFYGLGSIEEAHAYLDHQLLGPRLVRSVDALLPWASSRSAEQIFGQVDATKLRSCLTLFDIVAPEGRFRMALDRFFAGARDERTLALLNGTA